MPGPAEEWLTQSAYDLDTAKAMLKTERYIYVVFMCHLALEKALKGLFTVVTNGPPPRTHNLVQLAKVTQPRLNKEQNAFLVTINTLSVTTRYPDDLSKVLKEFNREQVENFVGMAEEVIRCIRKDPRLSK